MYLFSILSFLTYLLIKSIKRKYFISFFNISLFIYVVSLFITPWFLKNDKAWYAVGVTSAISMKKVTNEAYCVNLFGFIVFIWALLFFEIYVKYNIKLEKRIIYCGKSVNENVLKILFWVSVFVWVWLVLKYNHRFPLFNGVRNFYLAKWFSPIYLATEEVIQLVAVIWGINYVTKKKCKHMFFCAVLLVLLSANRSPLIVDIISPTIILAIYVKIVNKSISIRAILRKTTYKIIMLFILVAFMGLSIGLFRMGAQINLKNMLAELLGGNTFSDIRDGAFILSGYKRKYGNDLLLGRTYLASLISFVPSSISEYRNVWSWGKFTTQQLFGLRSHFGMRGGNSLEAYLNFGIPGVVLFSFLKARILAFLERFFYRSIWINHYFLGANYLVLRILMLTYSSLNCSSGVYNIYVDACLLVMVLLLSQFSFKKGNQNAYRNRC